MHNTHLPGWNTIPIYFHRQQVASYHLVIGESIALSAQFCKQHNYQQVSLYWKRLIMGDYKKKKKKKKKKIGGVVALVPYLLVFR